MVVSPEIRIAKNLDYKISDFVTKNLIFGLFFYFSANYCNIYWVIELKFAFISLY